MLLLDVPGDGNCMYYTILSFFLGTYVGKGHPALKVFKENLMQLIKQNKNKFIHEGPRDGKKTTPNIIHMSHTPVHHCCPEFRTNKGAMLHTNYCLITTQKGIKRAKNLDEWTKYHLMNGTWGGSEILQIIAGLTGLTIFSYTVPSEEEEHVPYWCIFNSKPNYGLEKILPGGEILLFHKSSHYQLFIPKDDDCIVTHISPYKENRTVLVDYETEEDTESNNNPANESSSNVIPDISEEKQVNLNNPPQDSIEEPPTKKRKEKPSFVTDFFSYTVSKAPTPPSCKSGKNKCGVCGKVVTQQNMARHYKRYHTVKADLSPFFSSQNEAEEPHSPASEDQSTNKDGAYNSSQISESLEDFMKAPTFNLKGTQDVSSGQEVLDDNSDKYLENETKASNPHDLINHDDNANRANSIKNTVIEQKVPSEIEHHSTLLDPRVSTTDKITNSENEQSKLCSDHTSTTNQPYMPSSTVHPDNADENTDKSADSQVTCKDCGDFVSKRNLKRHLKRKHGNKTNVVKDLESSENEEVQPIQSSSNITLEQAEIHNNNNENRITDPEDPSIDISNEKNPVDTINLNDSSSNNIINEADRSIYDSNEIEDPPCLDATRRPESSKGKLIKCRVCGNEMYKHRYVNHLKSQHPQEDVSNVRPLSQSSMDSFLPDRSTNTMVDDSRPPTWALPLIELAKKFKINTSIKGNKPEESKSTKQSLSSCVSINEILSIVPEFEYDGKLITCTLCIKKNSRMTFKWDRA